MKVTAQLLYIVTDAEFDGGMLFNVSIMFPNIPLTYPKVFILIVGLLSHC